MMTQGMAGQTGEPSATLSALTALTALMAYSCDLAAQGPRGEINPNNHPGISPSDNQDMMGRARCVLGRLEPVTMPKWPRGDQSQ